MNQPWYKPSKPNEIRPIPWLHLDAIKYFESILKPDFDVLEYGGGGSTLWLAQRCKHVTVYENNPKWHDALMSMCPSNVGINRELQDVIDTRHKVDLILIDGEPVEDRAKWIVASSVLVKSGGYVVLDNANRPEYIDERAGLVKYADLIYTVNGNESNTKYLVTEFWKMK